MASWLMRIVSSPGKSSRNRWAICSGLHALAHCRFFRCPCRRPFQGTTGPRTAAPPEVATTPASPRPSRRATSRTPWPCARHSAISSRSASDRYRPESGFDEGASAAGGMPPASRNHRVPTAGDTPARHAASSLARPAAIAVQNRRRSSRRATPGRPGEHKIPRPARSERRFRVLIATPSSRCCDDRLNPPAYVPIAEPRLRKLLAAHLALETLPTDPGTRGRLKLLIGATDILAGERV